MKIDKSFISVAVDLDPSFCDFIRKDGTLALQLKKALDSCGMIYFLSIRLHSK